MIYTGGIPLLSVMDFQRRRRLHWGIPRSSMTFSFGMVPCTEAQSVRLFIWITMDQELWDDPILRHGHFRVRFYWRYDRSTRYFALGHTLLIDGWFLR